jgi:outer membrane protein assembly factor BamA
LPQIALLVLFFACALHASWSVRFEGATAFSVGQLEAQLDLPEEMDQLAPERRDFLVKLSKSSLEGLYLASGYFSSTVKLSIHKEHYEDSLTTQEFIFRIYEGPRYEFGPASFVFPQGTDSAVAALADTSKIEAHQNGFYNAEKIANDLQYLRKIYLANGYLHLALTHIEVLDTTFHTVSVEYSVAPGIQVRMGAFHSQAFRSGSLYARSLTPTPGLSDTAWLNSIWELNTGEVINGNYYAAFRSKLFSTQLFSQLRLSDSLRADSLSDISLLAYERVPGETNYSAFFEQTYGFGASASVKHRNLLGTFNEGSFSALVAQNRQEVTLGYANPLLFGTALWFIPTAIRFDDRVIFNHEKLPAPVNPDSLVEQWEIANRGDITFGLSDHIRTRGTVDLRYHRYEEENEDNFKIKGELGFTFDFTDNSYDPVLGVRLSPVLGAGTELAKIPTLQDAQFDNGYYYTDNTLQLYFPIWRPLVSALGFSYGRVFHATTEEDAQTFYQGGGRSVRGYRFRSIFPSRVGADSVVVASREPQYFRLNQELRWGIPWRPLSNFQIVQFFDWARVNDEAESLPTDYGASLGVGLRFKWQFLTIRLDYALKKDFTTWKPEKFQWGRFVFDLAQAI